MPSILTQKNCLGKFNPKPLITIFLLLFPFIIKAQITGPTQVCEDDTATYTHPFVSPPEVIYNWGISGGFINYTNTTGNAHITWTTPGIGKLYVTLTEKSNGAFYSSDTIYVTIHSNTVPSITADPEAVCLLHDETNQVPDSSDCKIACQGSTISYTAPLNSGSTYQWFAPGATLISATNNVAEFVWPIAGLSSIKVIETNANGCASEHEVCVSIIEGPTALFNSPNRQGGIVSGCVDQNIIFTDMSSGATDWFWDFGDGTTSELQNPTHAYRTGGTYFASLTVKNECGCENTLSFTSLIEEEVAPEIRCVSTVCPGAPASYTAIMPDSTTVCDYSWQVQGGSISGGQNTDNITVNWADTTSGFGTITLTVSNCNNVTCLLPITAKVPIISKLTEMSGNAVACKNTQEIYRIPPTPGSLFRWQVTGGTLALNNATVVNQIANLSEVAVNWGSSPTGSIKVVYFNEVLGCGDSIVKNVTLLDSFNISGIESTCSGLTETYDASPSGNFLWTLQDDTGATIAGPISGPSANFTFTASGNYTVVAQDTSAIFCNEFARFKVKSVGIPPTPIAPVGDLEICPETYYEYNGQVPSAAYSLKWEFQNGTSSTVYGEDALVSWNSNGPWSIKLFHEAIDAPHCLSDSFVTIVTHKPNPVPNIIAVDTACINTSSLYSTTAVADRYEWEVSPADYGSIISGQYTNSIEVEWHNLSGSATIQLVTKVCDSTNTNTKSTYLKPQPLPEIIGYGTYCEARLDSFAETTNHPTAVSWLWDFGDGSPTQTTASNKVQHVFNQDGSFPVQVTVSYSGTCSGTATATKTFDVFPEPEATLSSNMNPTITPCPAMGAVSNGQQLSVSIHSPSGYTFAWSKDGVPFANSSSQYTPTGLGSFQVRVTNNTTGCLAWTNTIVVDTCTSPGGGGGLPSCPNTAAYRPDFTYTNNPALCGQVDFTPILGGGNFVGWNFGDPDPGGITNGNTHIYQASGYYQTRLLATFLYNGALCSADTLKTVNVGYYGDFTTELECHNPDSLKLVLNSTSNYNSTTITSEEYFVTPIPSGMPTYHLGASHTVSKAPGDYSVRMLVKGGGTQCEITDTVTVLQPGEANFTPSSTPYCEGTPVVFTDASTGSIVHREWDLGDGSGSSLTNPSREYRTGQFSSTPYSVKLVTTDHLGCKDSVTQVISVNNNELDEENAFVTPNPTLPICEGDSLLLSIGFINSISGSIIQGIWSNFDTALTTYGRTTGDYWVNITDSKNCNAVSTATSLGVIPANGARIFGDLEYCLGEEVRLNQYRGDPSVYTYTWLKDGIVHSSGAELTDQPTISGTIVYGAIADDGICPETTYVTVTVLALPVVNSIVATPNECASSSPTLTANASGTAPLTYGWNVGGTTSSIQAITGGLYVVTVTDSVGCEAKGDLPIEKEMDFSNLMTGCYSLCADDTTDFDIQGMGPSYSHNWVDTGFTTLQTGFVYQTSGLGWEQFQLEATKNGCPDTSDMFRLSITDCVTCSQMNSPQLDSVWCIKPDSSGLGDWVYGFSFKMAYPFSATSTINVGAPGGIVKDLSHTTTVFGINTITGKFLRTDINQDSLILTITLNSFPEAPGTCEFQLVDTLDYCPEACDMTKSLIDLYCVGLSMTGKSVYYFKANLHSNNTWPWNFSVASKDSGIIKLTDPFYLVENGDNFVEGFWEIDGSISNKCLILQTENPRSGECCTYELCSTIAACSASPSCGFTSNGFAYGIWGVATNLDTIFSLSRTKTNPNGNLELYTSSNNSIVTMLSESFVNGPNGFAAHVQEFRNVGVNRNIDYTIFGNDTSTQTPCQQDYNYSFAGASQQPWVCNTAQERITAVGARTTCMGTVSGQPTFLVEIDVERYGTIDYAGLSVSTSDGLVTDMTPKSFPLNGSGVIIQTIRFHYIHQSTGTLACFRFQVSTSQSSTFLEHCAFSACVLTDPSACCTPIQKRLRPPYRSSEEEEMLVDDKNGISLKLRPNPANESTNIDYVFESEQNNTIRVLNNYQKEVAHFNGLSDSGVINFNTADLKVGLYFIIAASEDGQIKVEKLIITH